VLASIDIIPTRSTGFFFQRLAFAAQKASLCAAKAGRCAAKASLFVSHSFVLFEEKDHSGIMENDYGLKTKRPAPDFHGESI
jgi:hypothetical protein